MKKAVLAALGCAALATGCGANTTGQAAASADTAATASPTVTPTAAECRKPATSGRTNQTIQVDGAQRRYVLYVPKGYDGTDTKLLLNLHGSSSDGKTQFDGSRIGPVADAHGFIVAAPDAGVSKTLNNAAATGGVWNVPGTATYVDGSKVDPNAPDDVAFTEALISKLSTTFCIDGVAVTGTSGGGRMSSALPCYTDKIDLIAPVAGLRLPAKCALKHGVDVVAFHGTADKVNPYQGGGPASWGPQTVPAAAAAWAALQKCTTGPVRTQVTRSVSLDAWSGCTDGVQVRLYSVKGGGHNWPGGLDAAKTNPQFASFIGVTTQEINAGELIWDRMSA